MGRPQHLHNGPSGHRKCADLARLASHLASHFRDQQIRQNPMPQIPLPVGNPALTNILRDRYVIDGELGRGGMATVYLTHDVKHDRPVALKVLHPNIAAMLGPERFLREIKVAARLQHPHILPVFDSGEPDGQLWYTMPYVSGESVRSRLARQGGPWQRPVPRWPT